MPNIDTVFGDRRRRKINWGKQVLSTTFLVFFSFHIFVKIWRLFQFICVMKVFRGVPQYLKKMDCAVAIGNFDGVHRGHQALLHEVVQAADLRGLLPCAVTFEPHPKEVYPHGHEVLARVNNIRDKVLDIGDSARDFPQFQ